MVTNNKKSVKEKLQKGEVSMGIFLLSGSSVISEVCSTLPIDWVVVDMEAAYIGKKDVLQIFQSLKGTDVAPMVRIPEQNKHYVEFALDIGAKGVLTPKVDNRDQANRIAEFSLYPPEGERGVNPVRVSDYFDNLPDYFSLSNRTTLTMVQIESDEAIDSVFDIASVKGIDVLFVGCGDLAMSYGQPGIVTGKKMDNARKEVLEACKRHKKVPGIFAYSLDLAVEYINEGFQFIAFGNDIKIVKEGIRNSIKKINSLTLKK